MSVVLDHRRPHRLSSGFSLVELMVAIVVGMLILAGVTSIIISNKQTYRNAEGLSQVQESTRTAMTLLERSIRGAGGTICGNGDRVANVLKNKASGWSWLSQSLQGFDGDQTLTEVVTGTATAQRVLGTDAFRVQSMSDSAYVIESHNKNSATIKVANTGDIKDDDILVACDADHASIFQATNVTSSSGNIVHNAGNGEKSNPGNCSKGLGFPEDCTGNALGNTYGFGPNSSLAKLSSITWFVGNNGRTGEGGRSLFRLTPGSTAVEVVAGVVDLQVRYRSAQSTVWLDAKNVTDWSKINTTLVTLTVASADRNVATGGRQAEGRLARQFTQQVSLRNRTL